MGKSNSKLIYVLIFFLIMTVAGIIFYYLEWEDPRIQLAQDIEMVSQHGELDITFSDMKSGIRSYRVWLVQNEREYIVAQEDFAHRGMFEKHLSLEIVPSKLKIKDGEAKFVVQTVDFSPLKNTASIQKTVTIDSVPPKIELISTAHYINPGGSVLVVYTVSDDAVRSGVTFAGGFFPGYPTESGKKTLFASYVAAPMDMDRDTPMAVMAQDKATNEAAADVSFYLRERTFRHDKVRLNNSFIETKAAQFQGRDASLAEKSPMEMFIYLNETLRAANNEKIHELCLKTENTQLWKGAFLRMKNAATMANFGDKRTYVFQGNDVGKSIHRGIDLASVRHAPIQAANSGKILFTGDLGIYGNTVIIDHGQGLASLYAHMSSISVKEGQAVSRGAVIGKSGASGFAAGDHLHFSILVHGVFVNPIEWWDSHWIQDNIALKLN
ncbi:MAG: M23 family metallopeptidase [Deltaproteobacteria bacterium]|nr:M23 family metallopeptidase [Deltaproteobacteria bacterium]